MNIFYLNGQFLPESEAKVSILDLGILRGFGVFDFLRTYNGKPFKLDEHLKRLGNSASLIGLKLPKSLKELKNLVLETLEKNHLTEAGLKIILTGGESQDQITPSGKPTLAVIVSALPVYPKSFYEDGVKVMTVPLMRILPEAKTVNYISAIMVKKLAKEKGAIEAIYSQKSSAYSQKGEIFEGTQSNFFCFVNNVLVTPKEGILRGITREVVLEIAENEYKKNLRPIKYAEIKNMEEAFITTTSKEIMPVVKIDEIMLGNGKVGEKTKRLIKLFKEYTIHYSEPF